jgi:hypothetical protein
LRRAGTEDFWRGMALGAAALFLMRLVQEMAISLFSNPANNAETSSRSYAYNKRQKGTIATDSDDDDAITERTQLIDSSFENTDTECDAGDDDDENEEGTGNENENDDLVDSSFEHSVC